MAARIVDAPLELSDIKKMVRFEKKMIVRWIICDWTITTNESHGRRV